MSSLSAIFLCSVLLALVIGCSGNNSPDNPVTESGVSLHTELGGNARGYERACGPRNFTFPADHGAHHAFRNEWWYVTGNVESTNAKKFGFHATFFRIANSPPDETESSDQAAQSAWSANEFYMAHFAISESGAAQISAHERFSRAAAGLAGAQVDLTANDTVRVWLDNWSLTAGSSQGNLTWQLYMADGEDVIDLTLRAQKPIVLQGDKGFSQKSTDPCNSSYYYALSRLRASGKLTSNGVSHEVQGSAWLDREWSSSALGDDQIGWDWFALQLNDGRDMMFYQLRKEDGSRDPYSHAVEIDEQGNKNVLPVSLIDIEIEDWWQSKSGARYPVGGKIRRADTEEVIIFKPLIENQELDLTVRYWEGAIILTDLDGRSIGRGYMELTGY